jgi:phage terminase large subunit-like protein
VFEAAKAMVVQDPALSRVVKVYRNSLEVPATGSTYRALSAEAYSKEGYNPSCVIFDEVHVQPDSALWDVMRLGMGTRERPLMLGITTAGALVNSKGEPSFCHEKYLYGKRVESGEIEDPAFFFRWWEPADPRADHTDPKVWAEANPSLGKVLRPAALASAARTTAEQEFRAKHLNLWVASLQSWLPAGAWADCADPAVEVAGPVVLGFDGSWSNDSTALIGCTVTARPHLFVVGLWERPPGQKGWRVPKGEVMATIRQTCADLEVVRVVADPAYWGRELQDLADEDLPIVEFPANSSARMVPATKTFEDTVLDRGLTHDGNPALTRHVGNARVRVTTAGRVITKDHKDSPLKIDAAVAAVYALDEVRHYRPPEAGHFNVW